MGQRFQIIVNTSGNFKIYHCQWLWGDYAIRRLGTAVRNFLRYNEHGYRAFEEFLKGSFYGKANDMNSFGRYDNEPKYWDDNVWILDGKSKRDLKKFLRGLDNNDGYLYIALNDGGLGGKGDGIIGYCFLSHGDLKIMSAEEFMSSQKRTEGFDKKQEKEYTDGLKTFAKLSVAVPPKMVKKELN